MGAVMPDISSVSVPGRPLISSVLAVAAIAGILNRLDRGDAVLVPAP
jgi:hypothetical protein